jgi:hypothetical protein
MLPPDTPECAHCHATLLPMWELWTDGDPAMPRALEYASADPASHREVRHRLLARMQYLLALQDNNAATTAMRAAWAVLLALEAVPGELAESWWRTCAEADAAHRQAQAQARLGRG